MPNAERNKDAARPVYDKDGNVVVDVPKKRGRPPLPRDESGRIIRDKHFVIDKSLKDAGAPPLTKDDGSPNADYYRWVIKQFADRLTRVTLGLEEMPKNLNPQHANLFFEKYAEINGVERKHLWDARSDAEKAIDAVEVLVTTGRSVCETSLAELEALERAMDLVDGLMQEEVSGKLAEAQERARSLLESRAEDLKMWRGLIKRVLRLRERATSTRPKGTRPGTEVAVDAARTLRFWLYVGRSNMASARESGPASTVFKVSKHHVVMALGTWEAQNGVVWYPDGPRRGEVQYEGVLLVCAPGHGKSEFGAHVIAEMFCLNHHHQCLFGHAMEDQAIKNLKYVRACFDPTEPQGRRCAALYPHVRLTKKGNQGSIIQMDTGIKVKQASGSAYGIKAAISGSDASLIWFDDCVDQKEVEQETERDRTFNRMNATWLARLRGPKTFTLTTTTLWHPDDAHMRRIGLARRGEIRLKVVIQACGGPDTRIPFEPLWPEMYPADKLRSIYKSMRNPSLYAAAYMADPRSAATRVIRSLRYFVPETPEHREWSQRARYYISVDPAATNREKSDSAGIVLVGLGPLRVEDTEARVVKHLTVMRIVEAVEIKANQLELADRLAAFVQQTRRRLEGVLIESKGGLHAVSDYLEQRYQIRAIRLDPGTKSKELRLRDVSTLIDDSAAGQGFRAVVEFPGKADEDGNPIPDEKYFWLYDQVLKFGIVPDDHALDAITQAVQYSVYELSPGTGWKTKALPGQRRVIDGPIARNHDWGDRQSGVPQEDEMAFFGAGAWN